MLGRSVAFFSCLFPPVIFSAVSWESATSSSIWSFCVTRFSISFVCSSLTSASDFVAVLRNVSWSYTVLPIANLLDRLVHGLEMIHHVLIAFLKHLHLLCAQALVLVCIILTSVVQAAHCFA